MRLLIDGKQIRRGVQNQTR